MKIKKVLKEALNEANIDYSPDYSGSIYSDFDKLEKIKDRKIEIARTIEMAKYSRRKAEKAGDMTAVAELDKLIAQLEEWYESAEAKEQEIKQQQGTEKNDGEVQGNGSEDPDAEKNKGKKGSEEDGEDTDTSKGNGSEEDDGVEADAETRKGGKNSTKNEPLIDTDGINGVDRGPKGTQGSDSDDADSSNGTSGGVNDANSDDADGKDKGKGKSDDEDEGEGGDTGDMPDGDGTEGEDTTKSNKGKGKGKGKGTSGDPGDTEDSSDDEESDEDSESEESNEDDGEEGESEDDGTSSAPGMPKVKDDKILVDPFSRKMAGPQRLPDYMQQALDDGRLKIEDEWEAFKRIVAKLKGESREGAKKAIIDYMKSKFNVDLSEAFELMGESLLEALLSLKEGWNKPGSIADIDDDEFGTGIKSAIDEINRICPATPITFIPVDGGVDEVSSDDGSDLDQEDARNKDDAKKQAEADEEEIKKYSNSVSGLLGMSIFKDRILRAMSDQADMAEEEEDTYSVLNRRNDEDPMVLLKGQRNDPKWNLIPNISVYCDCSGSWNDSDLERAFTALSVLAGLVEEGRIAVRIFYFANNVYSRPEPARREGGTGAWYKIQENIVAHHTNNVVLITDDDMDWPARNSDAVYVDGCVWFLWKKRRTQDIVEKLRGRSGTYEFNLWA